MYNPDQISKGLWETRQITYFHWDLFGEGSPDARCSKSRCSRALQQDQNQARTERKPSEQFFFYHWGKALVSSPLATYKAFYCTNIHPTPSLLSHTKGKRREGAQSHCIRGHLL